MTMPIIEPSDKSLKNLGGIHLWHGDISSCSQRVRITLAEKNLEWHSHPVSIPKNEHATPEYQAIHPDGLVPAFVDNGTLVIESCDIIEYIDEKYPDPRLRPKDNKRQTIMSSWLTYADESQADLKLLSHEFLFRPRKKLSAEELDIFATKHQNKKLVDFIKEWQINDIFPKEKLDGAVTRTDIAFIKLDTTLRNQEWLLGDEISIADIAWMPNIHRMDLMDWPWQLYPHLSRWYGQVKLRQSYKIALIGWEPEGLKEKFSKYVAKRYNDSGIHVSKFGSLTNR